MKVKFQKGSEEWQLFMDLWGLAQSVWGIEDREEYWEDVKNAVEAFASNMAPLALDLEQQCLRS